MLNTPTGQTGRRAFAETLERRQLLSAATADVATSYTSHAFYADQESALEAHEHGEGCHHDHDHDLDHDHDHDHELSSPQDMLAPGDKGSDDTGGLNRFSPHPNSWSTTNLAYSYAASILNGGLPGGLSNTAIFNSVEEALSLWTAVSPLRFTYNTDNGLPTNDNSYSGDDNTIRFGVHALSGTNGGTLAHGYYPPPNGGGLAGDIHFDSLDQWGTSPGGGTFDMIEVATHEIGHAIGLQHPDQNGQNVNAIMNAFYGARYSGPGTGFLFTDDINGVRSKYGSGLGYVRDQSGNLIVSGTEAANTFVVNTDGSNIFVSSSGNGSFTIPDAGINTIRINMRGGNDTITVQSLDSTINLVVEGFAGNDVFRIGDTVSTSDGIDGNITVVGGDGTDSMFYNDHINSGSITYDVSSTSMSRSQNGSVNFGSTTENVRVNGGTGNSTFNLTSTSTRSFTLDGRDGNDVFNIGNGDYDNTIGEDVFIIGGSGTDSINFDDATDTANDNYLFDSVGGTYTYTFTKSSEPNATRFGNDIENVDLVANPGNNVIEFGAPGGFAASLDFDINGNDGNDILQIGNGSNGIANMDANVTFFGDAGTDEFRYLAQNVGAIDTRTFNLGTLTGGTGGVFTAGGSTEEFILNLGTGSDVVNVNRLAASLNLRIDGNAGNDIVTAGDGDYDTNITGNIFYQGGPGNDGFNIADATDTGDDAYRITSTPIGGVTPANTYVFDKAIGGDSRFYPDLENFNIVANPGNNTFDLLGGGGLSSNLALTFSGRDGDDTMNYGDGTVGLAFYDQTTNFNGNAGIDRFVYNGQNMVAGTHGVSSTTINLPFSGNVFYGTTENLELYSGASSDVWTVTSLFSSVDLLIDTGNGNDTANIGGVGSGNVEDIDGDIDLNMFGGDDTLNYNDQLNDIADTYTLNGFDITRTASGTLTFDANTSQVNVFAGLAANTINATVGGLNDYLIDAGPGNDTINVLNAVGFGVDLTGGSGVDALRVNTDNTNIARVNLFQNERFSELLIGDGGLVTVEFGGNKVIRTNSISINAAGTADGQLDLSDNSMIVDYDGASPISNIAALIRLGYNGGNWGGDGIDSNIARLNALGSNPTALGFGEASTLGITSFMGQSVDSTAVLIRHTVPGDANLDGTVDLSDFVRLRNGFNQVTSLWTSGNFNFDDRVDLSDFVILRNNFGRSI